MRLDDVIKGMDCCLHMLNDDGDSHCDECPYNDNILNRLESNNLYCIRDLVRDARRALADEKKPRILSVEEMREIGWGHGWQELTYAENGKVTRDVIEAAWVGEKFIDAEESSGYIASLDNVWNDLSGCGFRMWSAKPSEEEMEAGQWTKS